jgi:hypothetical protein
MTLPRPFSRLCPRKPEPHSTHRTLVKYLVFSVLLMSVLFQDAFPQQHYGSITGKITDEFGGLIVNAMIAAKDRSGVEIKSNTNESGVYEFKGLAPGIYELRVAFPGFKVVSERNVEVRTGRVTSFNFQLTIAVAEETVTIDDNNVSTDMENNADSTKLSRRDLEALPNDPQALAAALRGMAGPSEGGNGAQITVDGFSNGAIPPKEAIREVRINRNPFSSEFEYPGYGGIEIYTQPGSEKWHGGTSFDFNDESLNSRNPFTTRRSPFQQRAFSADLGGPVKLKRASFSFYLNRISSDSNSVINATILDPLTLRPQLFNQSLVTPQTSFRSSLRADFKINKQNTLVGTYSFAKSSQDVQGVGGFSLPSRAFRGKTGNHTLQLTETSVLNERTIFETRLQIVHNTFRQTSASDSPALNVLDSFFGGGSQTGSSQNRQDRIELQNFTSWSAGRHFLKVGWRARWSRVESIAPFNFSGAYTFAGGSGPRLDSNDHVILGSAGQPEEIELSSLERYRRSLLFARQGLSAADIRKLGGGPTQFTIAGGDPEASVRQTDIGLYIQDEWRLRPNLTLSPGLRYENQTNIHSPLNFAPRMAFAWSPIFHHRKSPSTPTADKKDGSDAKKAVAQDKSAPGQSKTVIRGGIGVFYSRVSDDLTLQALRFNGIRQQQFVVSDPSVLDLLPNSPSISMLGSFSIPQTRRFIARDLEPFASWRSSLSIERQIAKNLRVTLSYSHARGSHLLRAVNINAPLPGTHDASLPLSGMRPLGQSAGDVIESQSNGRSVSNSLTVNTSGSVRKINFWGYYTFLKSRNTDSGTSGSSFDPYDFGGEWGRSPFDVRHFFVVGGYYVAPHGFSINAFALGNSGSPFNITIGRDPNGDTFFSERPAFATNPAKPGVIQTPMGMLDPNPSPGQTIIPRNFGQGPGYLTANVGLSKNFQFGKAIPPKDAAPAVVQSNVKGPESKNPSPKPPVARPYQLNFSIYATNVLNHTNPANPIGNIASPYFLKSTASSQAFVFGPGGGSGGNRQISLTVRLAF